MIVDAILYLVGGLIMVVADALPELQTAWDSARPDFSSWGATLGARVGPADKVVPIETAFRLLDVTFSYVFPAIVAYAVAHWIYSHLPMVGKG